MSSSKKPYFGRGRADRPTAQGFNNNNNQSERARFPSNTPRNPPTLPRGRGRGLPTKRFYTDPPASPKDANKEESKTFSKGKSTSTDRTQEYRKVAPLTVNYLKKKSEVDNTMKEAKNLQTIKWIKDTMAHQLDVVNKPNIETENNTTSSQSGAENKGKTKPNTPKHEIIKNEYYENLKANKKQTSTPGQNINMKVEIKQDEQKSKCDETTKIDKVHMLTAANKEIAKSNPPKTQTPKTEMQKGKQFDNTKYSYKKALENQQQIESVTSTKINATKDNNKKEILDTPKVETTAMDIKQTSQPENENKKINALKVLAPKVINKKETILENNYKTKSNTPKVNIEATQVKDNTPKVEPTKVNNKKEISTPESNGTKSNTSKVEPTKVNNKKEISTPESKGLKTNTSKVEPTKVKKKDSTPELNETKPNVPKVEPTKLNNKKEISTPESNNTKSNTPKVEIKTAENNNKTKCDAPKAETSRVDNKKDISTPENNEKTKNNAPKADAPKVNSNREVLPSESKEKAKFNTPKIDSTPRDETSKYESVENTIPKMLPSTVPVSLANNKRKTGNNGSIERKYVTNSLAENPGRFKWVAPGLQQDASSTKTSSTTIRDKTSESPVSKYTKPISNAGLANEAKMKFGVSHPYYDVGAPFNGKKNTTKSHTNATQKTFTEGTGSAVDPESRMSNGGDTKTAETKKPAGKDSGIDIETHGKETDRPNTSSELKTQTGKTSADNTSKQKEDTRKRNSRRRSNASENEEDGEYSSDGSYYTDDDSYYTEDSSYDGTDSDSDEDDRSCYSDEYDRSYYSDEESCSSEEEYTTDSCSESVKSWMTIHSTAQQKKDKPKIRTPTKKYVPEKCNHDTGKLTTNTPEKLDNKTTKDTGKTSTSSKVPETKGLNLFRKQPSSPATPKDNRGRQNQRLYRETYHDDDDSRYLVRKPLKLQKTITLYNWKTNKIDIVNRGGKAGKAAASSYANTKKKKKAEVYNFVDEAFPQLSSTIAAAAAVTSSAATRPSTTGILWKKHGASSITYSKAATARSSISSGTKVAKSKQQPTPPSKKKSPVKTQGKKKAANTTTTNSTATKKTISPKASKKLLDISTKSKAQVLKKHMESEFTCSFEDIAAKCKTSKLPKVLEATAESNVMRVDKTNDSSNEQPKMKSSSKMKELPVEEIENDKPTVESSLSVDSKVLEKPSDVIIRPHTTEEATTENDEEEEGFPNEEELLKILKCCEDEQNNDEENNGGTDIYNFWWRCEESRNANGYRFEKECNDDFLLIYSNTFKTAPAIISNAKSDEYNLFTTHWTPKPEDEKFWKNLSVAEDNDLDFPIMNIAKRPPSLTVEYFSCKMDCCFDWGDSRLFHVVC